MNIKIVDLNQEVVQKAKEAGFNAVYADYFLESYKTHRPVLMTASNPAFTFGGGIDAGFKELFYGLCDYKQYKGGGNERIGNICFVITVDSSLKATKEKVSEAIRFAIENTDENETLLIHGAGTGIGGLSVDEWLEALQVAIT